MSWLDKLVAWSPVKVNITAPIIVITNNSNNQNSNNTKLITVDDSQKTLIIDVSKATPEQRKELKPIIKEYIESGTKLLQMDTAKLFDNICGYTRPTEDKQVLEFFQPIIPAGDYEALEASLFLRSRFKEHKETTKLKADIIEVFGKRGKNISNLCTAGYFEKFLMQLYNSSKDRFKELYEIIAETCVLAVFVHKDKGIKEISSEIGKKVEICKRYGIGFLHIHGIGQQNVEKIKKYLEEQKDKSFFEKNVYENEKDHIIIIELLLK